MTLNELFESTDSAITKKIAALEKKYADLQGRVGMARERRRMKGNRLQSPAEQKYQTKMSEIYSQISVLKQQLG